ncbi:hypothetical protein JW752_00700 [Candidatus Peregrinibacteria bacterium]|nr:hypothetical protein [Candidatus Peregrinibacteria bacterium]
MKKTLIIFGIIFFLPVNAFAATMLSETMNQLALNQVRTLAPMNIAAEADGEITAEYGMNIIIDENNRVLWDAVDLMTATGTAVDNGKIAAEFVPIYDDSYRVLTIPVLEDFAAGENVRLVGARMRAYDRAFGSRFLYLDLNGDLLHETTDLNAYKVTDADTVTDQTPPYQIQHFTATLAEDLKSITFTWQNPPDWDFVGTTMERVRVRGTQTQDIAVFEKRTFAEYTDTDIQEGDSLTYKFFTHDKRNKSEPVVYEAVVETPATEEPAEEPEEEEPEEDIMADEHNLTPAEIDSLHYFYTYYKVREAIKCLRDDSQCLWAKINLVYTQEVLGLSDVDVSLSDRDIYLIGIRIKWPEQRFQEKCVEADTPDKTCAALGKSLTRAHYFLERSE